MATTVKLFDAHRIDHRLRRRKRMRALGLSVPPGRPVYLLKDFLLFLRRQKMSNTAIVDLLIKSPLLKVGKRIRKLTTPPLTSPPAPTRRPPVTHPGIPKMDRVRHMAKLRAMNLGIRPA
eukprot:1177395-Prorocentrum_minimum.AAC.6